MRPYTTLLRFFGMYAPFHCVRIAMYRKLGIKIGRGTRLGNHVYLDDVDQGSITIGENVLLTGYIHVLSHSGVFYGIRQNDVAYSPVVIKKGARISYNVTILRGVTIGENAVIGAGAVVTRDIPDNCLAVGVPAKPISYHVVSKSERAH